MSFFKSFATNSPALVLKPAVEPKMSLLQINPYRVMYTHTRSNYSLSYQSFLLAKTLMFASAIRFGARFDPWDEFSGMETSLRFQSFGFCLVSSRRHFLVGFVSCFQSIEYVYGQIIAEFGWRSKLKLYVITWSHLSRLIRLCVLIDLCCVGLWNLWGAGQWFCFLFTICLIKCQTGMYWCPRPLNYIFFFVFTLFP